jgi:hypothetical protein
MQANTQSHSVQDAESRNPQCEDIIRQDYEVRVVGGQKFIRPNAFQGEDVPLAEMRKPDYAKGVNMSVGVRNCSESYVLPSSDAYLHSQSRLGHFI